MKEVNEPIKITFESSKEPPHGGSFVHSLSKNARAYFILAVSLLTVALCSLFLPDSEPFISLLKGGKNRSAGLQLAGREITSAVSSFFQTLFNYYPADKSAHAASLTSLVSPTSAGFRILCILVIGAALAACGAAFQAVFKNPMASPDLLGANAGGSLGGALFITYLSPQYNVVPTSLSLFGIFTIPLPFLSSLLHTPLIQSGAETFVVAFSSIFTVLLVLFIGGALNRGGRTLTLAVLAGMIVSRLSNSVVEAIVYNLQLENFDDPRINAIQQYRTPWLLNAGWVYWWVPVLLAVACVPLLLLRWNLNALSFGDEEAGSMGVNVQATRIAVFICTTVVTLIVMLYFGQIGWIGLVAPHVARMMVGNNYKHNMPVAMLVGALVLLISADFERVTQIPVGVYTALIGAPLFLYFLIRGRKQNKREWV